MRNLDEVGLPNAAAKYNGKPVLIAKTGALYHERQEQRAAGDAAAAGGGDAAGDGAVSFLEMDINVHRFSYPARAGLQSICGRFCEMEMAVGFVIEGRSDEELPDVMLGAAQLNRCDWESAVAL